jgi:hypothetical protein
MNHNRLHSAARTIVAIVFGLAVAVAHGAQATDQKDLIKAAFIYNFARFTDWPSDSFAGAGSSVRICYQDDHPLAGALATIDGKQVGRRPVAVVPFSGSAGTPPDCHIVILTASEISTPAPVIRGQLTVGDIRNLAQTDVAVGLIQVGRQVRFQVNTSVIEQADLRMSSKLLRLAVKVVR